jgi:hypothetical protein
MKQNRHSRARQKVWTLSATWKSPFTAAWVDVNRDHRQLRS